VHRALEPKLLAALRSVVRRNAFVLGEDVRRLEAAMAARCNVAHGIGVSSGTAALALVLRGLGLGPGDEVVTTPFTFFATAAAVVYVGARPRFADVDPGTLNLDPAQAARACSRRTRALLPVHLFGQVADMDPLLRLARTRKLAVVEDACQAHGALYRGKPAGSFGAAACFSFYPSKNLGGLGDGGLIVTNNGRLAERLRRLRNCGRRGTYEHIDLGYNERLDNLQAAALLVKLARLDGWNRERRGLAAIYEEHLRSSPVRPLHVLPDAQSVYHLYTVRAPRRDRLQTFLADQGIQSGVFYPVPLHLQKAFRPLGYGPGDFPEAERASREVLSLPLYPGLAPGAVRRVARAVRAFYQKGAGRRHF
jgi:dTDP-4-amino-4,6-dideoxygalactose transaminase